MQAPAIAQNQPKNEKPKGHTFPFEKVPGPGMPVPSPVPVANRIISAQPPGAKQPSPVQSILKEVGPNTIAKRKDAILKMVSREHLFLKLSIGGAALVCIGGILILCGGYVYFNSVDKTSTSSPPPVEEQCSWSSWTPCDHEGQTTRSNGCGTRESNTCQCPDVCLRGVQPVKIRIREGPNGRLIVNGGDTMHVFTTNNQSISELVEYPTTLQTTTRSTSTITTATPIFIPTETTATSTTVEVTTSTTISTTVETSPDTTSTATVTTSTIKT